MNTLRRRGVKRLALVIALAAVGALAAVLPASAGDQAGDRASAGLAVGQSDPDATVQIIGGREATQLYSGMVAVYVPYTDGRTIFCGGVLLFQHVVATGAHCVTQDLLPTPYPTKGIVVRVGSNDRTAGQAVGVKEIRPYPGWDWASTPTPVDDVALVFLDRKVDATPFPLLHGSAQFTDTRLLGWGLTEWPPTAPPAPETMLREVDTQIQPLDDCAFGFAGTGDVCIGTPTAGACYGDSGGPALHATGRTWMAFGIASREGIDELCGSTVYTDLRYYAAWIYSQVFKAKPIDPPLPCACPMPVDTADTNGSKAKTIRWARTVLDNGVS